MCLLYWYIYWSIFIFAYKTSVLSSLCSNAFLLEYFISFILFLIKVHSSKSCPIFYCCFSLLSLPFILFLFFKRHDVLYSKSLIVDRAYDKRGWLHFDSQCGSSPSGCVLSLVIIDGKCFFLLISLYLSKSCIVEILCQVFMTLPTNQIQELLDFTKRLEKREDQAERSEGHELPEELYEEWEHSLPLLIAKWNSRNSWETRSNTTEITGQSQRLSINCSSLNYISTTWMQHKLWRPSTRAQNDCVQQPDQPQELMATSNALLKKAYAKSWRKLDALRSTGCATRKKLD